MYKTIVIAYDGTDASNVALVEGVALARLCKAQLTLLGIVVTAGGLLLDPAIVSRELIETEQRFLREALAEAARDFAHKGVNATTCLRDGDPATEIAAYAREIGADLVIVGHGHKRLLARWFEHAVDAQILAAMPCSLLVASHEAAPPA